MSLIFLKGVGVLKRFLSCEKLKVAIENLRRDLQKEYPRSKSAAVIIKSPSEILKRATNVFKNASTSKNQHQNHQKVLLGS